MTSKRHRHSHNDSHSHSSEPSSSPSLDPTRLLPFLTAHFGSAQLVERIPLAEAKVEDAILEESNDDEILDGEALLPRQIILVVVDEKEVEIDLVKMVSSPLPPLFARRSSCSLLTAFADDEFSGFVRRPRPVP